ncbi:MAG: substrate-binding domain-containing protein [Peptococcaceae bacterium]|jgi:phosphate transport system substrate-binding protein|nr:substrate-binding domain-containing protein [Peptococcaceae bacterium]
MSLNNAIQRILIPIFLLGLLLLGGCSPGQQAAKEGSAAPFGEADRLGGRGSIGAGFERGADWQPIVTNSPFQIGEKYLAGYWRSENGPTPYYGRRYGSYPHIDGSTVCAPLALEFARQHLRMSDIQAQVFVAFNTTSIAYEQLIMRELELYASGIYIERSDDDQLIDDNQLMDQQQPADILFATYPSEEELGLAKDNGEPLTIEPVCRDAFVFITHKDNPVNNLTLEQARGIYSGAITNWSAVGGADAPIAAYQREPNSGSQSGMEQLVMQGLPLADAQKVQAKTGMAELVEAVAEYQNGAASLGYTYKYYVEKLYQNDNIKILRVNGYDSGDSANYPLMVNYYGVIRANDGPDSVGRKFLDWVRSDEGQRCVKQAGYVPLEGG